MRGYPKHIATGADLYNCLALVQAGDLSAIALSESLAAIEEQQYITVPILSMSEDRKTVAIRSCLDATEGAEIKSSTATTIKAATTAHAMPPLAAATTEDTAQSGALKANVGKLSGEVAAAKEQTENTDPDMEEAAVTEITLTRALPKDATTIKIAAAQSPYERLGMTKDDFNSIKGVLKNYE